jgi:F-type H+-transporting ATPase subunit delta
MTSRNIKLAQPYAEALLDITITTKEGSLDKVITDLTFLSTILADSKDLRKALSNPTLSSSAKKKIIKSLFEHNSSLLVMHNKTFNNTILKFLMVLCDRGRISYLADVIERALELAYKKASIEIAYVSSSIALSSSQEENLTTKLQRMTGANQIKLKITVDATLLGGFIVQVGSKIIDNSVKGQLKQLSAYLGASVV